MLELGFWVLKYSQNLKKKINLLTDKGVMGD